MSPPKKKVVKKKTKKIVKKKMNNEEIKKRRKERGKKYYIKNKEKIKKYYNENKEKIKKKDAEYYIKKRDEILNKRKEYHKNNKDEIKEKKKEYYEKNKDEILNKRKEYQKNNEEKIKIYRKEYREREENQEKIKAGKIKDYEKHKEIYSKRKKEWYWNQPKCKNCYSNETVSKIANPKFDNYCYGCFKRLFPDDKRCKSNRLVKQNHIHENIIMNNKLFRENLYSYDIQIDSECKSRKKPKPDWFFDMGIYSIILECDEEQHKKKSYTSCDSRRDMQLMIDLGNRPIIFIRFNPDKYKSKRGKKIQGCFAMEKSKYVRNAEFEKRKKKLEKVLQYCINLNKIPDKEITHIHLFFDGYNGNKKIIITEMEEIQDDEDVIEDVDEYDIEDIGEEEL